MQIRRSSETLARRLSHSRQNSWSDRERLIYSAENGGATYGLGDLAEEDEGEDSKELKRSMEGRANGAVFTDRSPHRPDGAGDGRDDVR